MGRNLSNGIITKIIIKKDRNSWMASKNFSLEKRIDDILQDVNKMVDISLYELTDKTENAYEFSLKPEIIDNGMHELIKEMRLLTCPNVNCFSDFETDEIDVYDDDFKDNYSFKCVVDQDKNYYIEANGERTREEYSYFPAQWLLDNDEFLRNVNIYVYYIPMWIDISKYCGEDESTMLRVINGMKTKYYKTELSKAFVYRIIG